MCAHHQGGAFEYPLCSPFLRLVLLHQHRLSLIEKCFSVFGLTRLTHVALAFPDENLIPALLQTKEFAKLQDKFL